MGLGRADGGRYGAHANDLHHLFQWATDQRVQVLAGSQGVSLGVCYPTDSLFRPDLLDLVDRAL